MSDSEDNSTPIKTEELHADAKNLKVASSSSDQISTAGSSSTDEKNERPENKCNQEKDNLHVLSNDMFSKIALYVSGEIDSTIEDYKLVEKMNLATMEKYDRMYEMAKATGDNLHNLNQKFEDLQPYLDQIETIESSVSLLEQSAYKLDAYSKRLEERFKRLDRK